LIEKYQLGRCHRFDPVVSYVRQHHLPIPWGQHNFIGTPIESLYRAASQFGLCSGVTFPSVSPMLTMSIFEYATHKPYDEVVSTLLASMPHGQLLALHVHKAVARLSTQYGLPVESNVSKRERDCLELAAQGMRDAEIAGLLGISSRTVLFHLGNARRKLGADNRAQMIARAVALGLILVN
jgi:DNA-binding CsgD family transcriptional regulator